MWNVLAHYDSYHEYRELLEKTQAKELENIADKRIRRQNRSYIYWHLTSCQPVCYLNAIKKKGPRKEARKYKITQIHATSVVQLR